MPERTAIEKNSAMYFEMAGRVCSFSFRADAARMASTKPPTAGVAISTERTGYPNICERPQVVQSTAY